jgi:hypothetical protein
MFNLEDLLKPALADPGLSQDEKSFLESAETRREIQKFLSGAAGAAIAVSLAKYAKLGRATQIALGLAGFGAGRLLYDLMAPKLHKQEDRQFSAYNDKLKAYEINRNA